MRRAHPAKRSASKQEMRLKGYWRLDRKQPSAGKTSCVRKESDVLTDTPMQKPLLSPQRTKLLTECRFLDNFLNLLIAFHVA